MRWRFSNVKPCAVLFWADCLSSAEKSFNGVVAATDDLVTIVIAVRNAADTLAACLSSCIEQDYPKKEIVVVDGASTDGSVDIIATYTPHLAWWESKADAGIFDAWNKAIESSKGEWICFLGADDRWSCATSLSKLMAVALSEKVNFVCGRIYKKGRLGRAGFIFGEQWDERRMGFRMTVAHAGMLHARSLFRQFGKFDSSFLVAGDYEFLLRSAGGIKAGFVTDVVVEMGGDGVSSRMLLTVWREGYRALRNTPRYGAFKAWRFVLAFAMKRLFVF